MELSGIIKVGDTIKFEGHDADFEQEVTSLQVNHEAVQKASAGDMVGLKTDKKVKEGTEVKKV